MLLTHNTVIKGFVRSEINVDFSSILFVYFFQTLHTAQIDLCRSEPQVLKLILSEIIWVTTLEFKMGKLNVNN